MRSVIPYAIVHFRSGTESCHVNTATLIAAGFALFPTAAVADGAYAGLVRGILIVRQCGLADELAEAGFRLQVEALLASHALTPEGAAAERELGQDIYRRSWRDRGGGPVDPRCRREGAAATARFRAYILAE